MNILPLLIGGAIIFAVMQNKKSPSPILQKSSKFGSKEIGYEIINCNKVIIHDEKVAFNHAYLLGIDTQNKMLKGEVTGYSADILLMGDCLTELEVSNEKDGLIIIKKFFKDKKTIKFVFNLYRYFYSGMISIDNSLIEIETNRLIYFKSLFKKLGYDVSDLSIDFVKEIKEENLFKYPIIGSKSVGYEIVNCKDIVIYDAQKALSYAFNSGKNLPKNYQYNSADLDKKLFGKCLNVIQFSKENIDQARFIFDMIKYGYSGILATVGGNETLVTNELISFMQGLEMKFNINFTNDDNFGFVVEIIKE